MKQDFEETPLKIRSARRTIADGLHLYTGNFRRIFRATWAPALVCAVVSALYYQMSAAAMSQLVQTAAATMQQIIMQSALSLLSAIVTLVLMSYVFRILATHRSEGAIPYPTRLVTRPDGPALVRSLLVAVVWVAVTMVVTVAVAVPFTIGAMRQSLTLIILAFVLMVVAMVFMLPLVYPTMRYLTTTDTRLFSSLGSGYGQGLRHWGYIFSVLFVMALLATIVLMVTTLPAIILLMAHMQSQAGALMGDPLGMPSYMSWLSLLVYTLAAFIQTYVILALFFPAYYMAGSIEQQELSKAQAMTPSNDF